MSVGALPGWIGVVHIGDARLRQTDCSRSAQFAVRAVADVNAVCRVGDEPVGGGQNIRRIVVTSMQDAGDN